MFTIAIMKGRKLKNKLLCYGIILIISNVSISFGIESPEGDCRFRDSIEIYLDKIDQKIEKSSIEFTGQYNYDTTNLILKRIKTKFDKESNCDTLFECFNKILNYFDVIKSYELYKMCLVSDVPVINNEQLFKCYPIDWSKIFKSKINKIKDCELYILFLQQIKNEVKPEKYNEILKKIKNDQFLKFYSENYIKISSINLRDGFKESDSVLKEFSRMTKGNKERFYNLSGNIGKICGYYINKYRILSEKKLKKEDIKNIFQELTSDYVREFIIGYLKNGSIEDRNSSKKALEGRKEKLRQILDLKN